MATNHSIFAERAASYGSSWRLLYAKSFTQSLGAELELWDPTLCTLQLHGLPLFYGIGLQEECPISLRPVFLAFASHGNQSPPLRSDGAPAAVRQNFVPVAAQSTEARLHGKTEGESHLRHPGDINEEQQVMASLCTVMTDASNALHLWPSVPPIKPRDAQSVRGTK